MSKIAKAIVLLLLAVVAALSAIGIHMQGMEGSLFETLLPFAIMACFVFYDRHTYINPKNGKERHIDGWSFLLVLFFGMFYFAVKMAWRYAFGVLIVNGALIWAFLHGYSLGAANLIFWSIWAFLVQIFMRNHYRRAGWKYSHRGAARNIR